MKEMIKALIDDGYTKGALDEDGDCFVFSTDNQKQCDIPACLFPDITFEKSPVELKTLLVDDFEDSEEQEFIRSMLSIDKEAYLLKEFDSSVFEENEDDVALWCKEKSGLHFYDAQKLKSYFPKEIHEKVYLKDLIKKRKVKKSVWLSVDNDGHKNLSFDKPIRVNGCNYWVGSKIGDCLCNREPDKVDGSLYLSWEDEPIELTYEVEE